MNVVYLGTKVIESERKRVRGREKRPEKQHGVGEERGLWIRIGTLTSNEVKFGEGSLQG